MTTDPVERGSSEEASGAPLTPTEEEASRRPPSVTPELEENEEQERQEFERRKELNPDDFE